MSYTIIGASADRSKYGNKAVRAFLQGGWTVYPVNPKADTIEGIPACKHIAGLPEGLDRISLYVPPEIGLSMITDIATKADQEGGS